MADVAYGFLDLQEIFRQRVADIDGGQERIQRAVQESANAYSQAFNQLVSTFVQDVSVAQEHYEEPTGGTLQPLDEYGNPMPVRGRVSRGSQRCRWSPPLSRSRDARRCLATLALLWRCSRPPERSSAPPRARELRRARLQPDRP